MTLKTGVDKLKIEIEALQAAITRIQIARGEIAFIIENDPEDERMLRDYRQDLDRTKTVQIGPSEFPGAAWYEAYQAAARGEDYARTRDLPRRGAAALDNPNEVEL
jgi:hypothetical protein